MFLYNKSAHLYTASLIDNMLKQLFSTSRELE